MLVCYFLKVGKPLSVHFPEKSKGHVYLAPFFFFVKQMNLADDSLKNYLKYDTFVESNQDEKISLMLA